MRSLLKVMCERVAPITIVEARDRYETETTLQLVVRGETSWEANRIGAMLLDFDPGSRPLADVLAELSAHRLG